MLMEFLKLALFTIYVKSKNDSVQNILFLESTISARILLQAGIGTAFFQWASALPFNFPWSTALVCFTFVGFWDLTFFCFLRVSRSLIFFLRFLVKQFFGEFLRLLWLLCFGSGLQLINIFVLRLYYSPKPPPATPHPKA